MRAGNKPGRFVPGAWPSAGFRRRWIVCLLLMLVFGGCATTVPQPEQQAAGYQERALTSSTDDLRVSSSVLSAAESRAVYGLPLAQHGIQPVWLKVENNGDVPFWLLSLGLDPHVIPPTEAAEVFARDGDRAAIEARFRELAFRNPVPPRW